MSAYIFIYLYKKLKTNLFLNQEQLEDSLVFAGKNFIKSNFT